VLGGGFILATFHDLSNSHAASHFGKDGESHDGDSNGYFLVAGDGTLDDELAELALDVEDGAAIEFTAWSTANAGKHRSAKLATKFTIQATDTSLSGTTQAISIHVQTTVGATNGTAQNNVFFVHGVVKHPVSISLIVFSVKTKSKTDMRIMIAWMGCIDA